METGDLGFPGNYMMRAVASLEEARKEEKDISQLSGGNQSSSISAYDQDISLFEFEEEYITISQNNINILKQGRCFNRV